MKRIHYAIGRVERRAWRRAGTSYKRQSPFTQASTKPLCLIIGLRHPPEHMHGKRKFFDNLSLGA